jgi:SAM-dependent methyltransferase/uncharacterized protein YbaR (Trm112 family)
MKRFHFEVLRPVCPACKIAGGTQHDQGAESPLEIGWIARETEDSILEGGLYCTEPRCRAEYPIVDGLPVLVPDPRTFVSENILYFIAREDLDGRLEALLGECCGPGSAVDSTRLHLSTYAWDHYAEFDPEEAANDGAPSPGSIVRAWRRLRSLSQRNAPNPVLEVGCSVGRISHELAEEGVGLVLGIDTNVAMLRMAQRAALSGQVVYPRRRHGLLYDRREFVVPFEQRRKVDFWIADGTALPFARATFDRVVGLNVLDSTVAPLDLLSAIRNVTADNGEMLLATPFDWSGAVTPPAAWIGGHSVRAPGHGSGPAILRSLLTPGAHPVSLSGTRVIGEIEQISWTLRSYDRSTIEYQLYGIAAKVEGD